MDLTSCVSPVHRSFGYRPPERLVSVLGESSWGEVLHNTPSASGCDTKTRFLDVHFVVWLGARIEEELARGYGTANLPDLSTRHLRESTVVSRTLVDVGALQCQSWGISRHC